MGRRAIYPWFHWFDEDQHQISRDRFGLLTETSIRKIVTGQARRMGLRARVTINGRWVWIRAERISRNHLTPADALR